MPSGQANGNAPTPCTEWDLRALVNHIAGENLWAAELFPGKTMADVGDALDGDVLGDDPIAMFNRSVAAAKAVVSAPGAVEATCHLSFGDYPGSEYAKQLFMDLLIHGWDVAKATGQDATLDPQLVEACYPVAEEAVAQFGQYGVFGTKVGVPADVSRQTSLLALVGRQG